MGAVIIKRSSFQIGCARIQKEIFLNRHLVNQLILRQKLSPTSFAQSNSIVTTDSHYYLYI